MYFPVAILASDTILGLDPQHTTTYTPRQQALTLAYTLLHSLTVLLPVSARERVFV